MLAISKSSETKILDQIYKHAGYEFFKYFSPERVEKRIKPLLEKAKIALDPETPLEQRKIWNVDYEDLKQVLTNNFHTLSLEKVLQIRERERIDPSTDQYWTEIYYNGIFSGKVDYASNMRKLIALKAKLPQKYKEYVDEIVEYFKPVEQIMKLLSDLKPLVVKGRKPSLNPAKEVYRAPVKSQDEYKKVQDLVKKFTVRIRKELIQSIEKSFRQLVDKYFTDRISDTEGSGAYSKRIRSEYATIIRLFIEAVGGDYSRQVKPTFEKRKDYEAQIKSHAESTADDVLARFLEKNVRKLTSIVSNKELKDSRTENIRTQSGDLSGDMVFNFEDGSSFKANNSIVTVWNARQPFYRFPTTFHDIVMPDGSKHKMKSEEWMNREFVTIQKGANKTGSTKRDELEDLAEKVHNEVVIAVKNFTNSDSALRKELANAIKRCKLTQKQTNAVSEALAEFLKDKYMNTSLGDIRNTIMLAL